MKKMRVLDLFSGIGGFSLGLERAGGFQTVAFCEIEEYPRKVLAKHWPGVKIYEDVRTLTASTLVRDGIAVDVICGGFPCQDISFAGRRAGLEGARSGLWIEYARLIGELRPRFVVIENVPGLLSGGDDIELPPDRCVCGWSSGWRGVHHDLPSEQPGALCASGYRHEREGAPSSEEDAVGVWRHDMPDAQGNGQVGRGARLAAVRASAGDVSHVSAAVPTFEAEAGRISVELAADDRWTSEEAEWLGFVDGPSGEGCAHDPRASDGGEPQGTIGDSSGWMVCEACGRDMDNTADRFVHASWFGRIQRDLAALGYDSTWDCIPACAVGAPHRRDRVWIIAHADKHGKPASAVDAEASGMQDVANASCRRRNRQVEREMERARGAETFCSGQVMANANGNDEHGRRGAVQVGREWSACEAAHDGYAAGDEWSVEPDVRGMVNGISPRLDGDLNAGFGVDTAGSAVSEPETILRDLWFAITSRAASQGSGQDEQLARELANRMSDLPHALALAGGQGAVEAASIFVHRLRQACEAAGALRDASEPLLEAWQSLSEKEAEGAFVAACGRADWTAGEWLGVGRVAKAVPSRVDRLKGLGNAVVPQIPELIGRAIMQAVTA